MTLLKIVESSPGLYYSYGTDITLKYVSTKASRKIRFEFLFFNSADEFTSLQRRSKLAKGWKSKPIWKQV